MLAGLAHTMIRPRQRSHQPAGLAAGVVLALSLLLAALPVRAASFCINYSATPDVAALRDFDFCILSPDARVDVAALKRAGHTPYAYLSVVEVAKDAAYRTEVAARKIPLLGKNDIWQGDLADVAQPAWADFVVDTLADSAAQKGFGGFFLDTADSVELLEKKFPQRGPAFRDGLVALIRQLKAKFPQHRIILNRGFPMLARLTGSVDGVLVESLFQKYDFAAKRYVPETKQGTEWLLNNLRTISQAGVPVYVVDYVNPADTRLAETTARRIAAEGFVPFISTVELDGRFLAPVPLKRAVPEPAAPPRQPPVVPAPQPGAVTSFDIQPSRTVPSLPPALPAVAALPAAVPDAPRSTVSASPLPTGEVPRFILTLFGNQARDVEELVRWPIDTSVSQVAQMPLEWLGYEVDYLNVHTQPLPADLDARYAAIMLDRFLQLPRGREGQVADWLIRQQQRGRRVIFFGALPFNDEAVQARVLGAFQISGTGLPVKGVTAVQTRAVSPRMNYEAPVPLTARGFSDMRASAEAEVLYSVTGTGPGGAMVQFDPVFIAPWGGLLLDAYALFRRPSEEELWMVDPFYFFQAALGRAATPVPDTTTRDGVRIFFSHIDGDGFRHRSSVEPGRRSGEVVVDRIVKPYPFPFTVSFIEAETRGLVADQPPGDAELLTRQARAILALPKVEVASHAYTHPFFWDARDRTVKEYARMNLLLAEPLNHTGVDLRREIEGSVRYLERELCPPGKPVKLFLWSGNCRPWPEALRMVRELGIENMNGGGTSISRKQPSLTRVAARSVPWGDELQITAANENENVYRERWAASGTTEAPFYGGFILAQDGFERMEKPRRLKPVNIYFHWYSGDNLASLNALTRLFDWSMKQELHSLAASDYAALVRDARSVRIFRQSDTRWTLVSGGRVRTFRLPQSSPVPDVAASRGVTGWRLRGDGIYVHTDGSPQVELVLSEQPAAHLRLEASTAEIQFSRLAAREAAFTARDIRSCQVTLAGLPARATATITVNGKVSAWPADAGGTLKMELPNEARVEVRLNDQ